MSSWTSTIPAGKSMPGTCPDCGGQSRAYKGSIHRWRCIDCVEVAIGLNRPHAARDVPKWIDREGVLA